MSDLVDPPLGSIVTVAGLGLGVVRFKGQTAFRPGKWVGVELQEKKGKNDGSVEGTVYFKCEPLFGVFVPPSKIQAIHGSELEATPTVCTTPYQNVAATNYL
jgi:dynactin 1